MRLIIAGSRHITGEKARVAVWSAVLDAMEKWKVREIVEVVTGGADGIDAIGKEFAERFRVAHKEFPADWEALGKAAGPKRNAEMAEYADALILVWDGSSRGSASMRWEAEKRGLPIHEVILR